MAWTVLILSGLFEAVWAAALGRSDGLTRPGPAVVFLLGVVVSMGGLAWALCTLPTGTAYAVWVGVGAVATVAWAMAAEGEPATPLRIALLGMIVAGVVGLQALEG